MANKFSQFTIRINEQLNQKATDKADSLGVSRAEVMRRALSAFCNQTSPNTDSAETNRLLIQLEAANEARNKAEEAFNESRSRSDTIIMQLSQQIDRQQLQLEDIRRNRSIFARIRDVFVPSDTWPLQLETSTTTV